MARPPRSVYWLIALGVLAVSTSAVLVKLSSAPPVVLAFYRVGLAWLVLAPLALTRERVHLRRAAARDVALALMSGAFLALHYAVWFFSLRLTSVASSTVLVTTQPIWVMLIAYLLWRERATLASLAGMAIALVGVYFIGVHSAQQGGGQLLGDGLAVLAAILVSGYLLIGQRLRPRMSLLVYVFLVYGAAAAVLGALAVVMRLPLGGYSAGDWWLFAALAVVPTVIGHTLFNWALQHVPASVVSVAVLGEPVGAVVLAFFLLAEIPDPTQILAGVAILGGIGLFLHYRQRGSVEPNPAVDTGGPSIE